MKRPFVRAMLLASAFAMMLVSFGGCYWGYEGHGGGRGHDGGGGHDGDRRYDGGGGRDGGRGHDGGGGHEERY